MPGKSEFHHDLQNIILHFKVSGLFPRNRYSTMHSRELAAMGRFTVALVDKILMP